MSNELFTTVNGKKQDAPLHEPILDNKKADVKLSRIAIARAVRTLGISSVEAARLYGVKSDGP